MKPTSNSSGRISYADSYAANSDLFDMSSNDELEAAEVCDPRQFGYEIIRDDDLSAGSSRSSSVGRNSSLLQRGREFDEEIDVESTSDESDEEQPSYPPKQTSVQSYEGEYDEEHLVPTSSSDTSPREDYSLGSSDKPFCSSYPTYEAQANIKHRDYGTNSNKHSPSGTSLTNTASQVDQGVNFGLCNNPSTYSRNTFGQYVAGTGDVRIQMPPDNPEIRSLLPGKKICTSQRNYNETGKSAMERKSRSNENIVDDRNSLEAQYSDRKTTSFSKHEQKRNGAAQRKKKADKNIIDIKAENIQGHVGDKDLNEILAYIGEKDNELPKGKKKKDRKDKRPVDTATEKKKQAVVSFTAKKKEAASNQKKKAANNNNSSRFASKSPDVDGLSTNDISYTKNHRDGSDVNDSDLPSQISIIQSSPNNHSRIILNGSLSSQSVFIDDDGFIYNERSIDEAIEERRKVEDNRDDIRTISDGNPLVTDFSPDDPSQYIFEEDFIRVKTPEPAEEEFQVVQKKKRNQKDKEKTNSNNSRSVLGTHHNNVVLPQQSAGNKMRSSGTTETPRPSIANRKVVEIKAVSQRPVNSTSEFPSLTFKESDTRAKATAIVQPFSYAAKVASRPSSSTPIQQNIPISMSTSITKDNDTSQQQPVVTTAVGSSTNGTRDGRKTNVEELVTSTKNSLDEREGISLDTPARPNKKSQSSPYQLEGISQQDVKKENLETTLTSRGVTSNDAPHKLVTETLQAVKQVKQVEFPCFHDMDDQSSTSIIQFGFDNSIQFGFTSDQSAISETRDKSTESNNDPKLEPVNILEKLLSFKPSHIHHNNPDAADSVIMMKTIKMLKKEWDSVKRRLHDKGERKLVYWTKDFSP